MLSSLIMVIVEESLQTVEFGDSRSERSKARTGQFNSRIPAIVSYVNEHKGYVTKTKLLKLLYLFDVEFFLHQSPHFHWL